MNDDGNGGKRDVISIGPMPEMHSQGLGQYIINSLSDLQMFINHLNSYCDQIEDNDDYGDSYDWWSW